MPSVIDELIVRLGLDAKDFTKGQKEAAASFIKTRDEARKTGKDIEDTAKKVAVQIDKMTRNIITLFATIQGARGMKELVSGLTQANAELGRFGANVGLSPQRVAAWGAAVQQVGGNAGQAQQTIAKLSSTFTAFKNGMGNLPQEFFFLRAKSGVNINPLADTEESLVGISTAIQKLSRTDRKTAFNLAQGLGIDAATFEVMRQYGPEISKHLQSLEKVGPTDKAIEQAQKLQEAWAKLVQTLGVVAQKFMEVVSPHLTALVENFTRLIERLANDVDWDAMGEGIGKLASASGELMSNMDGATAALTAFFALWTGAQFAKVIANMLLLRGLGGGSVSGPSGAARGGGLGGALRAAGAAALAFGVVSTLGRGSVRTMSEDEQEAFKKQMLRGAKPNGPEYRDLTRDPGYHGERLMGDVKTEGRPVSKGNPLPVQITSGSGGGGGGFWSGVGEAISNFFAPKANASQGGGGSSGGGSSGGGGASASVPNIAGMTDEERNTLGLILKHESGGRNVMNYMGAAQGIDPTKAKGYTAQGYYQILNSNWRRLAPKLGITTKNAMASTLEEQTKVALALMRESGVGNWSNFNPSLRRALARGDKAGAFGTMVQGASPSGAEVSALNNSVSNDNRRSSSVSNDTRIGNVNVYTQGPQDGASLADQMWGALLRSTGQSSTAAAANTGPA